jgi:hypothetical protein
MLLKNLITGKSLIAGVALMAMRRRSEMLLQRLAGLEMICYIVCIAHGGLASPHIVAALRQSGTIFGICGNRTASQLEIHEPV